ncbi:hypothetical protein CYR55_18405 [Chimaeribacter californicus]|uniref:DUF943 domain-containing protein n=1 Tax=Chimaeribacter californicus TaxID=2060067 RepID=A0A2N5DYC1_9GAMM|nr:DUF943 family protein [Chimaeribacter californicus]PLR32559.1 hypothetical protein CYR55_18405 [Chimaeribacter californicus]
MHIIYKSLIAAFSTGIIYTGIYLLKPTEIISAHDNHHVLVKSFPMFDKTKIEWWKNNKNILKEKYNLPKKYSDGSFSIMFLDYGEGYKVLPKNDQKSDLACFDDMKSKANCVEKKVVLTVSCFDGGKTIFHMSNGHTYLQLTDESELKRVE